MGDVNGVARVWRVTAWASTPWRQLISGGGGRKTLRRGGALQNVTSAWQHDKPQRISANVSNAHHA
jgi:hypothetical protein